MVSVPLRVPGADGVNVRVIVQVPDTTNAAVQVLVSAKSVAFAPLIAIPETVNEALPELVSVTFIACDAVPTFTEPKPTEAGLRLILPPRPVPVKVAV